MFICDVLRDLLPFLQFKKRGKYPRRRLLLVACNSAKSNTPPWVFFTFFKLYKWYNGTKSRNASYQCIQGFVVASQQIFTCLKSTVEILEKGVEYVQR